MFVIYNKNLNRYFKHPRVGVWWSNDIKEAESMLDNIKKIVVESGISEIISGMEVIEISETIKED